MTQNNIPISTGDREVTIAFEISTETACLYLGPDTSAWLTVDSDGDVYPDSEIPQGMLPTSVWFRETLRIELPASVSAAALHRWLSSCETQDLLEVLHCGHEVGHDSAHRHEVGTLTDDAEDALTTLESQALDLDTMEVWDASEWLCNSTLQDLWKPGMRLAQAETALRSQAQDDGVHIYGSIARALLDKAVEAANDGQVLTPDQHSSLVQAGREDELHEENQEDAQE